MNVKEDFFSERELKKALRDSLTRAAWLASSNILLVCSEHAHVSYPGLFFRPPGFSPYMGREERRYRDPYSKWSSALLLFILAISKRARRMAWHGVACGFACAVRMRRNN